MEKPNDPLLIELGTPPLKRRALSEELRERIVKQLEQLDHEQTKRPGRVRFPIWGGLTTITAAVVIIYLSGTSPSLPEANVMDEEQAAIVELRQDANVDVQSGLLLGLRQDGIQINKGNPDVEVPVSNYRTLWIAPEGDRIVIKAEGRDLFVPYKLDFWKIETETLIRKDDFLHRLTARKVAEHTADRIMEDFPDTRYIYTEKIDFIGNRYAALSNKTEIWKDDTNDHIEEVYVEKWDFIQSDAASPELLENFVEDDKLLSYAGNEWTIVREKGRWIPKVAASDATPQIQLLEVEDGVRLSESIVTHDELCTDWNSIVKFEPQATDAVCSPLQDMIAVFVPGFIRVYPFQGRIIDDHELEIPLKANEQMVMSQWATGSYVEKWNEWTRKVLH